VFKKFFSFLLLLSLSIVLAGQIDEGNFLFIEKDSKKVYNVSVEKSGDSLSLSIKGNNLFYLEIYLMKGDSTFLLKRKFKLGFLNYVLDYSPIRLRFLLPFEDNKKWQYEGIETSTFHKTKIKSYGYVFENDDGYKIYNITFRDGSVDTSIVEFDKMYKVKKISIDLPKIFLLRKMLGFKTTKLIFENYGKK